MCLQCCAKTIDYGEFAPKWYLVKATQTVEEEMDEGDWGLVRINDPDLVFKSPLILPENSNDLTALVDDFCEQLYLRAEPGHSLYKSLKEVKFPFAVRRLWVEHGHLCSFEARLYLYLAWFVANNCVSEF